MKDETAEKPRLSLLDIMILLVAIAIGLAWARFEATIPGHLFSHFQSRLADFGEPAEPRALILVGRVWEKYVLAVPVAMMVAVALLAIRLRGKGTDRRLALREPGASACAVGTIVLGLSAIRFLVDLGRRRLNHDYCVAKGLAVTTDWWESAYDILRPNEPGIAVIACWSILLLTGHLRFVRSMTDALGWIVAVYWIGALALYWLSGQI